MIWKPVTRPGLLVLALVSAVGCGGRSRSADELRVHSVSSDGDTTLLVSGADPELRRARRIARCTIGEFRRRLESPPPGQTELMLKAAFRDRDEVEYLWMRIHRADGESAWIGTIQNDPTIGTVRYGDTVRVSTSEVSDWYAVERDTLVAGFTIRVYERRGRTSPSDADGYVIDTEEATLRRLHATHCG